MLGSAWLGRVQLLSALRTLRPRQRRHWSLPRSKRVARSSMPRPAVQSTKRRTNFDLDAVSPCPSSRQLAVFDVLWSEARRMNSVPSSQSCWDVSKASGARQRSQLHSRRATSYIFHPSPAASFHTPAMLVVSSACIRRCPLARNPLPKQGQTAPWLNLV